VRLKLCYKYNILTLNYQNCLYGSTKYGEIRSFYLPTWITQTTKRAYRNQACISSILLLLITITITYTLLSSFDHVHGYVTSLTR